jgi:hypothetical protein
MRSRQNPDEIRSISGSNTLCDGDYLKLALVGLETPPSKPSMPTRCICRRNAGWRAG